ncbi:DUF192 domain-containing protein [bacterium]|nr:MAG: DUF192 domain-containing protein [bacterium]
MREKNDYNSENLTAESSEYEKEMDKLYSTPVQIGNNKLLVQIADTDSLRQKGLSGTKRLTHNQGMLFDFTNTANRRPSFWMKDMNFSIDIIWIKDNKIIGIEKSVPAPEINTPDYELKTYSPPGSITHVLEVNAGWSDQNGISVGDKIEL